MSSTSKNVWPDYATKLSGCWKCLTFEVLSEDGKTVVRKPHGDTPIGRANLSPTGYLSAHMTVPSLVEAFKETGEQWRGSSDANMANVARGLAMYCGQLELYHDESVNPDGGLWWATKCDVSVDPNRIGRLEKRKVNYFQEGGKEYMVLQPFGDELTPQAEHVKAVLKWEKFE